MRTKHDGRIREWGALSFHDPVHILQGYRAVEDRIAALPSDQIQLSDRALRLRTNALKPHREGRDAALFAHGMATVLGTKVHFAQVEKADYDFVVGWGKNDTWTYTPVQLKEYAPAEFAQGSLNELLHGQRRYPITDTVLAIRLNRKEHVDFGALDLSALPFSQLWFFWSATADGSMWRIFGDALSHPQGYEFRYPET